MRMRNLSIFEAVMIGAVLAGPAVAQTCSFTTECFDGDGCSETSFSFEIETEGGATRLVSDAETIPLSQGGSDETRVYVGVTESAFHLLTHSAEGEARYSTHIYDGPLMLNYLGRCEVAG